MADVSGLENQLNDLFGKNAPAMPEGGKRFFVKYMPIFVMIGAVLSVLGVWGLWSSAHWTNRNVDMINELSKTYGSGETISTSEMTLWVWLAIAFTAVNAVLYFMAYNPLKAHAKKGWNLIFYAALLSVAYSVVTLFISGRGFGSFVMGLVFSAIGFWILFQIRPAYLGKEAHQIVHTNKPKHPVEADTRE